MFSLFSQAIVFALLFCFSTANLSANPITLNDWAFNIDGEVHEFFAGDSLPGQAQLDALGLGQIDFEFSSPGKHFLTAFFDFEFDWPSNTYFNEFGQAHGTLAPGQSWEIDEPGFVFGNIYDNLLFGSLDNENSVPQGFEEDVSLALGWDFNLAVGETAYLSLFTGLVAPSDTFYLSHTDPEMGGSFNKDQSLYFWGELDIVGRPVAVSEPSAAFLLVIGIFSMLLRRRTTAF